VNGGRALDVRLRDEDAALAETPRLQLTCDELVVLQRGASTRSCFDDGQEVRRLERSWYGDHHASARVTLSPGFAAQYSVKLKLLASTSTVYGAPVVE
jgi:hypothetical protein